MKKNIALMAGGNSGERSVSLRSAIEVEKNIDKTLYNVYKVSVIDNSWFYEQEGKKYEVNRTDFSLDLENGKVKFDGVFIIIHGTPGENGLLQGYLEMMGVPFTSCGSLTSAVTFDKVTCNAVVRELGMVKVARSVSCYKDRPLTNESICNKLNLPVFVKPSQGGSSIGMTKVKKTMDLEPAMQKAFEVHERIIIEEAINGIELSCGVFEYKGQVITFPLPEIDSKKEFFDYEAKYDGLSDEITPAPVSKHISDKVQAVVKEIYHGLNCKSLCRVDFIYNKEEDTPYFLEVNTIPGQSAQSIVPNQVRSMGWSVADLYNRMIEELF